MYFFQANAIDVDGDLGSDGKSVMEDLDIKIKAPPMRTKEKNGACKRKRKEAGGKGSKAKTRGRTHTPSYACAAASKADKLKARQVCALCLKAGRPTGVRHKSKMCPFTLGPAPTNLRLKSPELPRLRVKGHKTSYKSGKPVQEPKEKKPRILSVEGNNMTFVME
jgi:hypothetical protein